MNLLTDIITYVRRIIKTASDQVMSDALIVDYINRFYTTDVPARLQLFELKSKYSFMAQPLVDQYNIPYYPQATGVGSVTIAPYPMFQMFMQPVLCDGAQIPLFTDRNSWVNVYPNFYTNEENDVVGDGSSTYSFSTINNNIVRAHIDVIGETLIDNNPAIAIPFTSLDSGVYISAQDADNNLIVLQDVGPNYPANNTTGDANVGNLMLRSNLMSGQLTVSGTIDYSTGEVTSANFGVAIPSGNTIQVKYVSFAAGRPGIMLFYNNVFKLRPIPDVPRFIELDAYLTPTAFLNSADALPFGYMAEYIARGAARKILSDTGDWDQFDRYEGLFREQEMLVTRRTDRQRSVNRTPTIFTDVNQQGGSGWFNGGQGT